MPASFSFLRFLFILFASVATIYTGSVPEPYSYISLLLLLLLVTRLGAEWRGRLRIVQFAGELWFISWLLATFGGMLFLLFLSAATGALYSFSSKPLRVASCLLAVILMNVFWLTPELELRLLGNVSYGVVVFLLAALQKLHEQRLADHRIIDELSGKRVEGHRSQRRILEYAKRIEDAAQMEERNRIAREIHDELGHKLIRMKLMLDAAAELEAGREDKPAELVREVRLQLTGAMELLHTTIRKLKPGEEAMAQYSLQHLIAEFGQSVGIQVHYEQIGLLYELYPSEEVLLYRNAREAMANAVRHGLATEVWITLRLAPNRIVFEVANNGLLPELDQIPRGYGLMGMEERAAVLGGHVRVSTEAPFTVTTDFPHRHKEPDVRAESNRAPEQKGGGALGDPNVTG